MTGVELEIVVLEEQPAAAVRGEVPVEGLADFFGSAFQQVMAAIEAAGVDVAGPPFGYYPSMPAEVVVVEAGIPVATPFDPTDDVHLLVLPAGRAVTALHYGPYETLETTYAEVLAQMAARGLTPSEAMWESYLSDPVTDPDPATWRTLITWPVGEDRPQGRSEARP